MTSLRVTFAAAWLSRRLGELARLHRHVGAGHRIGVAVGADDVVDAGVEADDEARLGPAHHPHSLPVLVALIGEDFVADRLLVDSLAVAKRGSEPQASRIEHEALLRRALAETVTLRVRLARPKATLTK